MHISGSISTTQKDYLINYNDLQEIGITSKLALSNTLQVCLDSGAKKVLIPTTSFPDFSTVPPELMASFQIIPYSSAEDAVMKALGAE